MISSYVTLYHSHIMPNITNINIYIYIHIYLLKNKKLNHVNLYNMLSYCSILNKNELYCIKVYYIKLFHIILNHITYNHFIFN